MKVTIYPSIAGGFPDFGAAFGYIREVQEFSPCGVCSCPAPSYLSTHYPDTLREPLDKGK